MINIDSRILSKVDEDELWLLIHLSKRLDKHRTCFPSNDLLCSETGWNIDKLQKVKGCLIKKRLLKVTPRKTSKGRGSNLYTMKTPYLNVFVNVGEFEMDDLPENPVEPTMENPVEPPPRKSGKEVLSNTEVLVNEVIADPSGSAMKGKLFTDAIEAYDDFCKVRFHVGAKIDGAQGNAMKKILVYLRANSHDKSDEGILNAWKYILQNWEKLDDWLKGQVKLTQINSNMLNIINQLKYGHNSRSIGTTAATIDALEALARKLETGG